MTFYVGQKIMCVDDRLWKYNAPGRKYRPTMDGLTVNKIYTVRAYAHPTKHLCQWWYDGPMVWLEEIVRPKDMGLAEPGFAAARFVPAQELGMLMLKSILDEPYMKVFLD